MLQTTIQEMRPGSGWNEWTDMYNIAPVRQDEFEYLLVIHPDMDVYSKVLAERQYLNQRYPDKESMRSKPHVAVAGFVARDSMEETLIRWIQRVCSTHKSFDITLNNFSGIPPHTVYLRIQDHLPFNLLTQKLGVINEYILSNGCPPVKWSARPHLSFSGHLSEDVYERAMRDYSQRTFFESFTASELVLLKKIPGEVCKIINIFGLMP
ncbi:MAG: 2'-5' RNA ligase family protein [Chitinophagaceae bacterium]|nr:2'-5' RNA ligase family protein [Chitinophagaceae bacterium]